MLAIGWEVLRTLGPFRRDLLPASDAVARALGGLLLHRSTWLDIAATLARSIGGLSLALLLGVPLGLAAGSHKVVRHVGLPTIDFLRSIPVTTLYPVFVLTLGIGDRGKVGMIALGCSLVIALHTAAGFERKSKVRYEVSRLYGASTASLLLHVALPEMLPGILTGFRVGVGLSLIISTLTEMFMGARSGMGQALMSSYAIYDLSTMYAYLILIGTCGFLLNRVCVHVEARVSY